ncbi:MAG: hypothetical protein HYX73_09460 [Acidobacteria bacterium]|nr:hypothetical protein [Acidobacteriota bacterium]
MRHANPIPQTSKDQAQTLEALAKVLGSSWKTTPVLLLRLSQKKGTLTLP